MCPILQDGLQRYGLGKTGHDQERSYDLRLTAIDHLQIPGSWDIFSVDTVRCGDNITIIDQRSAAVEPEYIVC